MAKKRKKKKLLVITGAGASLEFGMPSVKEIDRLMEQWALEIAPLKDDPTKSLYSWVKQTLSNYVKQNPRNDLDAIINFENLLYTVQCLGSIAGSDHWQRFNSRLKAFIQLCEFPEIIRFRIEKRADHSDFDTLVSLLVDRLLEHFRVKCRTLETDKKSELDQLKNFFNYLKSDFDLGFINLNYDNVILTALPDLNTGYNRVTGEFDRGRLYKDEWNFCYHVHGSVYFDMKGGDHVDMHGIRWNDNLGSPFRSNSSGRSKNYTSEGLWHINSNIITGLDKANQILKEPFSSYFMQTDRLAYVADAVLFIGYGFSDLHLNSIFPFIRYDKNKKRKVVIVDWASNDEDGLCHRHDGWSHGVFMTLPFNGHEMGDGKSSMPNVPAYYKKRNKLEKSSNPDYPLAVWYNGFLEACKNAKKIRANLR
jgi:hypothetical protein